MTESIIKYKTIDAQIRKRKESIERVLFESAEYTHINHYFIADGMINTIHNNCIKNYENINKDDFVLMNNIAFSISDSNLTNFTIPFNGKDV